MRPGNHWRLSSFPAQPRGGQSPRDGAWTRAAAAFLVGLGLATADGCTAAVGAFKCESNAQCTGGQCEFNGLCSFPDGECDSGKRFGDAAPAPVGGMCVPLEEAGTGSTGPGQAPTESTGDASDGEGSTGPAVLDEGTTADDGTGSVGVSGPPEPDNLLDDLDRPDDLEIGSGWVEKRPQNWQLVDGRIAFESSGSGYEDNIVYRPLTEAVRDLEVSVELEVLAEDLNNYPQVHVRLQPGDIDIPGSVTGYLLYLEEDNLRITRQIMGAFDSDVAEPLSEPIQVGLPYRLTLSVSGESPVHLEGRLHAWQDGAWQLIGGNIYDDNSADQIVELGTMGFSGADAGQLANFVYDDFTLIEL